LLREGSTEAIERMGLITSLMLRGAVYSLMDDHKLILPLAFGPTNLQDLDSMTRKNTADRAVAPHWPLRQFKPPRSLVQTTPLALQTPFPSTRPKSYPPPVVVTAVEEMALLPKEATCCSSRAPWHGPCGCPLGTLGAADARLAIATLVAPWAPTTPTCALRPRAIERVDGARFGRHVCAICE
jgi:hypothetical protein